MNCGVEEHSGDLRTKAGPYLRRYRLLRTRTVFLEGLFFSSALAPLLVVLWDTGVLGFVNRLLFLLIPGGLLGAVLVAYFLPHPPLYRVFSRIDRYYGLRELLVTAMNIDPASKFGPILVCRAEQALDKGLPKEIFPGCLKKRYLLVPLFLVLTMFFFFIDLGRSSPTQAEGRVLAETGRRLAERADEYDLPYNRELARQMQELSEQLERESLTKNEALEEIEKLRRQVLGMIDNLERTYLSDSGENIPESIEELEDTEKSQSGGETTAVEGTESGEPSSAGGQPGKESSEKSFGEDAPENAEDREGEKYVDSESEQTEQELEGLREMEESLSRAEELLRNRGKPEGGDGSELTEEDRLVEEEGSGVPGGGGKPAEDGGSEENETGGSLPGSEPDNNLVGEMYEPRLGEREPGIPLEGHAEPTESPFGAFVRALPEYTFSELTDQDINGEYRRSIEEAVTNEDIPIDLRRVVRDYFLILGSEE